MNHPTLMKMLADQRSHEIATRAARAAALGLPARRRDGVFAHWAVTVRARLARGSSTSTPVGLTQCCPAT